MNFGKYFKYGLFILIFIQFVPFFLRNIKQQYTYMLTPHTRIGVVTIKGTLSSATRYIEQLREFFKDTSIKAILLQMESGGGAAGTSQALFNEIKALKQIHMKPVIAFAENLCGSGAYYVACAADSIIATPSAFVGSIGVYIPHPELKDFLEEYKVKYSVIKTGTYKAAGNPLMEDTPEQRAMFQSLTDDTYQQFTKDVAQNREKLSLKKVDIWGNGRIFTGNQAFALGLVDKIGSQTVVEQELREKAPIEGEIEWVKAPTPSKIARWFGETESESMMHSLIGTVTPYLQQNITSLHD